MMTFGNKMPSSDTVPASDTTTRTQQAYRRVLIAVEDANQAEHVVELARRVGASEARVLHLNLREVIGGRRFAMETESAASYVVEATIFELRLAGIAASGHSRHALLGQAAEAIIAEATGWGADVIVLGPSRRGELTTRLFGSVTLRVLQHATCPVLVAPATDGDRVPRVEESAAAVTGADADADDDHLTRGASDNLRTIPAR